MVKLTLKSARVNIGLTQSELARKVGVNKKTIWSWENGITFPNPEQINLLCIIFNLKYDNIIFLPKK